MAVIMQCAGIGGPAEGLSAAIVDTVEPAERPLALELLGNHPLFDDAYRQHFAFVWRSLRRLGAPSELLDDAAQDVFIVALGRAAQFQNQSTRPVPFRGSSTSYSQSMSCRPGKVCSIRSTST